MYCTKCGKAIQEGNAFCGSCGAPVASIPPSSAETRVLPPMPPTPPSPPPPPSPSPAAAVAAPAAAVAVPTERPGGVTLLAFWQFAIAGLLAMSTLSMVSFIFMRADRQLDLVMVAMFGGFALIVFTALAAGVGLMGMRPYGRALLLPFAWFSLIMIPIGTLIGFFALRYVYKPEIRAAFAARPAGWPIWVTGGFAVLVLGTGAFAGMTATRNPGHVESPIAISLEIGIMTDSANGLVPSPDNLVAADVENAAQVSEPDNHLVNLRFTPEGAAKMERLTGANIGRQMGFLVDGRIDSVNAATIQGPISSRATVVFADPQEAARFVAAVQARP